MDKTTICDSQGNFSDEIDVVIYDRQYAPLVFNHFRTIIVPVEAVYAVFEAKQEINAAFISYAQQKVASVRQLVRTSAEFGTTEGTRKAIPQPIGLPKAYPEA